MDHLGTTAEVVEAAQASDGIRVVIPVDSISESVAAFAHEVMTPLATMNATLELLSYDHSPRPDDLEQLLACMQRGVTWITSLVNNLTAWSAMSNGLLALDRSPTVVSEWIEQAIALVQPIAGRREQTILLDCPRPSPIVIGDAFRLSQVMVNLLTNASRYGAWGDTITITVIDEGDAATVRVSDHGRGIPAHEREQIFRPRVRGSQGAEYAEGQGLGLHIVAGIVAQHGGTVGVDSVMRRGTTFSIRLLAEPG